MRSMWKSWRVFILEQTTKHSSRILSCINLGLLDVVPRTNEGNDDRVERHAGRNQRYTRLIIAAVGRLRMYWNY